MIGGQLEAKKLVFLGAGNMAEAMIKGLLSGGACPAGRIFVTDVQPARLEHFARAYRVAGSPHNAEAIRGADLIVLAVKPQVLPSVIEDLKGRVEPEALLVSIMAGIPTGRIERELGGSVRVVRVMPNLPALVRAGISALCSGSKAIEKDLRAVEILMGAVGHVIRVEEKDLDTVTAISGSGPAYVFALMEAMLEAAAQLGLEKSVAERLVHATVEGAAKLIAETGEDAGALRRRVTSKGGTTEAAFKVLNEKAVHQALVNAVLAAQKRASELSGS